jgi:integrase
MAQKRDVFESSLEINPKSDTAAEETEDTSSSFDHSSVAQSILVPNGLENEALGQPNYNEDQQEVLTDRLAIISNARHKSGLTDTASIEYLKNSTRKSTTKIYDNGWRQWHRWCLQQNPKIVPTAYNCANILQFLVANNKYSSNHLNTLRSSIASVFRELYPDEMPLAIQPTIQAFFAAKRRSEVKIPTPQQLETWDTNKMTMFILSSWADSNNLNLYDLQLKTIALLCLATMARPRSDMGRLQFRDTIFQYQDSTNSTLTGVTVHFREPKETQVKTSKLGVLQDSRLCPVSTLNVFVQKTAILRRNLPVDHTLFLAFIEKPESVTSIRPSTMSNWVKLLMEKSGIDTTKFKAHSIRAASSTKAVEKGHSIDSVKEHAGWSLNSNTFEKFYYKPTNQESSSTAITYSIFSQTENTITLEDGVEPTEIVLGTTNNPNVGETKSNNVIDTHPWYRRFLGI